MTKIPKKTGDKKKGKRTYKMKIKNPKMKGANQKYNRDMR